MKDGMRGLLGGLLGLGVALAFILAGNFVATLIHK